MLRATGAGQSPRRDGHSASHQPDASTMGLGARAGRERLFLLLPHDRAVIACDAAHMGHRTRRVGS